MAQKLDTPIPFKPEPLDPVKEAANAKTVIARMSGRERCYDVSMALPGTNGAKAYIFLGTLPVLPPAELAKACQRQWPVQFKRGLKLRLRERPTDPSRTGVQAF